MLRVKKERKKSRCGRKCVEEEREEEKHQQHQQHRQHHQHNNNYNNKTEEQERRTSREDKRDPRQFTKKEKKYRPTINEIVWTNSSKTRKERKTRPSVERKKRKTVKTGNLLCFKKNEFQFPHVLIFPHVIASCRITPPSTSALAPTS